MREIKFRAWDIKRKEWISTCNMVMSLSGKEFGWNFGYEPLKDINRDEFILSQFTGLKDKNGKEIYEGDIVELDSCNPQNSKSMMDVCFLDGKFNISEYLKLFKLEVIGNIYENPELLDDNGGVSE